MINVLSYIGMSFKTEVCLWTLLGLLRTIFDATLFKVNANLKQVWQMNMPSELSLPVQRVLRTMISGVMLVQCFSVYVYLASYIVLLYPAFLEERPTLILPWLLLAAIRKLLCELISLALGLGTCVLLGPARPPCIKFLIIKLTTILPAFYMWMLIFSYYHTLKIAAAFKTFRTTIPVNDNDYGLELAVRRRRTKSLLGEDQLRQKLVASLYEDSNHMRENLNHTLQNIASVNYDDDSNEELKVKMNVVHHLSITSHGTMAESSLYEEYYGNEVVLPRDTDRIMEQFVLMLLRISHYIKRKSTDQKSVFNSSSNVILTVNNKVRCSTISNKHFNTPCLGDGSNRKVTSYLGNYSQIFPKKMSDVHPPLCAADININNNNDSQNSHSVNQQILSETRSSNKTITDIITEKKNMRDKETETSESMENIMIQLKVKAVYESDKENNNKMTCKSSRQEIKFDESVRKQDNKPKESTLKLLEKNKKDRKKNTGSHNRKNDKN